MKKDFSLKFDSLNLMKYVFGELTFAAKISLSEDYRKLKAHINDLINQEITLAFETECNMDSSHFGMPSKDLDLLHHVNSTFPSWDHFAIFGFNRN